MPVEYSGDVASRTSSRRRCIVHMLTDLRLGGTQTMLLARIRGLPMYEHHVWALREGPADPAPKLRAELATAGASIHCPAGSSGSLLVWFFGAVARALRLRPVVIHSCTYPTHLLAPTLALFGGSSVVHGKESTDDWMTREQARREVRQANRASVVVAVSQAAARSLARGGKVHTRIRVVWPGVPDGAPSWRVLPEPDDAPVILYVGRLDPAKGLAELVEAFYALRQQGRRVRLQIQGDGPAESALRKAFAREPFAGVARVITMVETRDAVGAPAQDGVAIFTLPSHYEGFGVVLVEAMRRGLPIVATSVGGIPEVVEDGVNAILVPPRDAASLARALARLLDDPALRSRLGSAGPARASRFTEAAMCAAWERIYEEAAGPGPAA